MIDDGKKKRTDFGLWLLAPAKVSTRLITLGLGLTLSLVFSFSLTGAKAFAVAATQTLGKSLESPGETQMDLTAACIEVSRPAAAAATTTSTTSATNATTSGILGGQSVGPTGGPSGGQASGGAHQIRVVPLEPLEGAPGHGLFRLTVREEREVGKCPGGLIDLFFSRVSEISRDDTRKIARDFFVRPVCGDTREADGSFSGRLCFKSKTGGASCPGGVGVSVTFFVPPAGAGYEESFSMASVRRASLLFCDELNSSRDSVPPDASR